MHRVFRIPELVECICNHVDRERELFRLCCTASLFLEPALDFLWEDLYGLDRILRCFPRTLWSERPLGDKWPKLYFTRPLCAKDWIRFNYYSKRVREVTMREHTHAEDSVFEIIHSCITKPEHLFPRLKVLTFDGPYDTANPPWSFGHLLLVPSLSTLNIALCMVSLAAWTMIGEVYLTCPNIVEFDVFLSESEEDTEYARDSVSDSICHWNNLKSVIVPSISREASRHLSALPQLTELCLRSPLTELVSDMDDAAFVALKILKMDSLPHLCAQMLRFVRSQHLQTVEISMLGPCSRSSWLEVIGAITAFKTRRYSLTTLSLSDYPTDDEPSGFVVLGIDVIRPLLSLKRLGYVTLDPWKRLDLENKDIRRMARAWPELSRIRLGDKSFVKDNEPICRVTMEALEYFVKYCPFLYDIDLEFVAAGIELPISKPGNGSVNKRIKDLNVEHCLIAPISIPVVASYLSSIFPFLYKLETDRVGEASQHWKEVEKWLPFFTNARKQEKDYWDSSDEDTEDVSDDED